LIYLQEACRVYGRLFAGFDAVFDLFLLFACRIFKRLDKISSLAGFLTHAMRQGRFADPHSTQGAGKIARFIALT
jgi:hypothetical protein